MELGKGPFKSYPSFKHESCLRLQASLTEGISSGIEVAGFARVWGLGFECRQQTLGFGIKVSG